MQYVLLHDPGNTPRSHRRRFFAALAHGVKWVHLYHLQPSSTGGGDFCDGTVGSDGFGPDPASGFNTMYQNVLNEVSMLGQFDDIVSAGVPQAQGAKVALVFSETSDIYLNDYSNAGAGKRSLFLALRHEQVAVDIVIEDDLLEESLINEYAVLFATCSHLTQSAGVSLGQWVHRGGTLFATAGAALLNETNGTNSELASLFGVTSHALLTPHTSTPAEIQYEKQDLPFATVIDRVTLSDRVLGASTADAMVARPLAVFGDKGMYTFAGTIAAGNVLGSFADGLPAVVRQARGAGSAILAAFYPGLSYLETAIPRRPV
jgi:hypothetical protein